MFIYSEKLLCILKEFYQKYREMISKIYCGVFCKATEIRSAKILKGVLETCWEVFCKITEKFFAKILRTVLLKYWYDVFKNTKRWSAKILKFVLKNCKFLVKNQELGLFPVKSWPSILGGQKIISNCWEQSNLQICHFWY